MLIYITKYISMFKDNVPIVPAWGKVDLRNPSSTWVGLGFAYLNSGRSRSVTRVSNPTSSTTIEHLIATRIEALSSESMGSIRSSSKSCDSTSAHVA